MSRLDLVGQKFGRLTVIKLDHIEKRLGKAQAKWKVKCECGNTSVVYVYSLKTGNTQSCGCYAQECRGKATFLHGDSHSAEFRIWSHMLGRCYDKNDVSYRLYGARGIKVCRTWKKSYATFLKDMGRRPSPKHSIDRIDNNKSYSKANCRWTTVTQQARNKRNNRSITYKGTTLTLVEWAEKLGFIYNTLSNRLNTLEWSVHKSFTFPVRTWGGH